MKPPKNMNFTPKSQPLRPGAKRLTDQTVPRGLRAAEVDDLSVLVLPNGSIFSILFCVLSDGLIGRSVCTFVYLFIFIILNIFILVLWVWSPLFNTTLIQLPSTQMKWSDLH